MALVKLTLAEIIKDRHPWFLGQLKSHGILVDEKAVYFANNHPGLKDLYRGSRWESGWANTLARLPGAEKSHVKRFGLMTHRCVKVPLEVFEKLIT